MPCVQYMRLPTVFNADIGLFVVASNRWMLPRSSLYVMHFTLGPFKPWLWWSSWLVREDPTWQVGGRTWGAEERARRECHPNSPLLACVCWRSTRQ